MPPSKEDQLAEALMRLAESMEKTNQRLATLEEQASYERKKATAVSRPAFPGMDYTIYNEKDLESLCRDAMKRANEEFGHQVELMTPAQIEPQRDPPKMPDAMFRGGHCVRCGAFLVARIRGPRGWDSENWGKPGMHVHKEYYGDAIVKRCGSVGGKVSAKATNDPRIIYGTKG